jgi:hypothetical protein
VIDVNAITVPTKVESVPSVALEPTCQYTLQAWAPFSRTTLLALPVTIVDPALKMNTELGLPAPFSVSVPSTSIELAEAYTPAVRVSPPMFPTSGTVVVVLSAAASL